MKADSFTFFLVIIMIFSVFLFLISLSIIFIIMGYVIDIPLLSLVGSVFLVGCALISFGAGVEVKTGENVTNVIDNGTISSQEIVDVYTPYDFGGIGETSFSWILLVLGMFMFVFSIMSAGD